MAELETIGQRIKRLRKAMKLTQIQAGKIIGVSGVAVGGWERDESKPTGENLFRLAKLLGVDESVVLYGGKTEGFTNAVPVQTATARLVPVISWVQAGQWTDTCVSAQLDMDGVRWLETTAKVSDSAFALEVRGDSMTNPYGAPSIPEGSTVIVEPRYGSIDELNGKIIVAMLDGGTEATIKKLQIDGPTKYLVPLNPTYKPMEVNGNCRIVGRVRQVVTEL